MPIIFGKKHKCPDCGAVSFGCLHIGKAWGEQDYLELACEKCCTTYRCDLPKLTKKILYLDQLAISHMMRSRQAGKDRKWSDFFDRLKSMVQWQRIICPTSWEHRAESEFSKDRYAALMDTCRKLAMGNRLRASWDIQARQIYQALQAFMVGTMPDWSFDSKEAFEDNPNTWHDHFAIDVDFALDFKQVADRRESKMAVHKAMESLYSDPTYLQGTFEEHVQRETEGFARGLLGTYDKERRELLEMMCGVRAPDPIALLSSPGAQVVQMVLMTIQQESQSQDRNSKVREFFFSPQFRSVPAVRINAVMRAAMALKSRDSGRKPKPSDQYDVEVICSYMPYCDAMLIDGEMRSLATDGKAQLDGAYDTMLFSARTLPKLHEWLDQVETSFPPQQREAVADVYEERFERLKLHRGRNLLEARRAMMTLSPTSRTRRGNKHGTSGEPSHD